MKNQSSPSVWRKLAAATMLATLAVSFHAAQAQGTAFTYQGRLNDGAGAANGGYDLQFSIYGAGTGGTLLAGPVTNAPTVVSNGLFTVQLDFGASVFTGSSNWLQIGVRTNGSAAGYKSLSPRQLLTPVPYAMFAASANAAGLSGTLPAANFSGTYGGAVALNNAGNSLAGNGAALTDLNASRLAAGTVPNARLAGDVAFTDSNQVFTAQNTFMTGTNSGGRLTVYGTNGIDSSSFNGLGFQFYNGTGEGAVISSHNNSSALISFYTKQGNGYPPAERMLLDPWGGLRLDQQSGNSGMIDNGTTNGTGLTFGVDSGEGIASQRQPSGGNQYGLDFYTDFAKRLSISQSGNVLVWGNLVLPANPLTVYSSNSVLLHADLLNFSAGLGAGNVYGNLIYGVFNTAIGNDALGAITNGDYNVALGSDALGASAAGDDNTAIGAIAMYYNLEGTDNTAVGFEALVDLSSGSDNIALGSGAGDNLQNGGNNIYIGNEGNASENNVIRIGSSQSQAYIAGQVGLGGAVPQQTLSLDGGMNIDQGGGNSGVINNGASTGYGLTFGSSSGEGIASQRQSTGGNQYGLDFYTDFTKRLSISQSGLASVTGDFLVVNGGTPVYAYLGDDGIGNDVQIGSQKSGVTAVSCYNTADNAYMHLYCSSITIEGGSDLAEPFKFTEGDNEVPQGAVVVIDGRNPGHLKLSDQSYDTHVAGVVSGANGINPGIQMQQQGLLEGGKNVALTGRVYVQADTSNGPIQPGDLLTTSGVPGHAMKVTDHARAAGAILGKAMTALDEGHGMVLVLVTLQ
jgi:hypothetical protein